MVIPSKTDLHTTRVLTLDRINMPGYKPDYGVQSTIVLSPEIISLSSFRTPSVFRSSPCTSLSHPLEQSARFLSEPFRHVKSFTMTGSSENALK